MKYCLGPVIQHLMISRAAAVLALETPCQLPGAADFSLYVQVNSRGSGISTQLTALRSRHSIHIVSIEGKQWALVRVSHASIYP